jgi:hypothetical protein
MWISREYTNHYTCVLRNRLYARNMVCITGLCLQKAFEDELGVPCPRIRVLDFTVGPCWSSFCCFTCRKQNAGSWVEQFGQFVSGAFRKLYTVVIDFIWFYGYLDIWNYLDRYRRSLAGNLCISLAAKVQPPLGYFDPLGLSKDGDFGESGALNKTGLLSLLSLFSWIINGLSRFSKRQEKIERASKSSTHVQCAGSAEVLSSKGSWAQERQSCHVRNDRPRNLSWKTYAAYSLRSGSRVERGERH